MNNLKPIYATTLLCFTALFIFGILSNQLIFWYINNPAEATETLRPLSTSLIILNLFINIIVSCTVLFWGFKYFERRVERRIEAKEVWEIIFMLVGLSVITGVIQTAYLYPETMGNGVIPVLSTVLTTGLFTLFNYTIAMAIIANWRLFEKADYPGYMSIIPIVNLIGYAEIAKQPNYYGLLLLIPFVNIFFAIPISVGIAKSFNRSTAFGIGILLLGVIFVPMIAFGNARWKYSEQFSDEEQRNARLDLSEHLVE